MRMLCLCRSAVIVVCLVAAAISPSRTLLAGDEQVTDPEPVADAGTPPGKPALQVSAFVDAYFAYNKNRPADHANFFPGVGTSAKRRAISGIAQALKEVTVTLEHRPVEHLILKLEGRYDRSSAPAFTTDDLDPEGLPLRQDSQFLVLLGAVATF